MSNPVLLLLLEKRRGGRKYGDNAGSMGRDGEVPSGKSQPFLLVGHLLAMPPSV